MNAAMTRSAKSGWHQRGYNDGFHGRDASRLVPDDLRATYTTAYRAGKRERERLARGEL